MALLGQTTTLEAISAIVLLFTAFYFIFRPLSFKDNWQTASLAIVGKDILLSLDFTGKLYNAAFSEVSLKEFINKTSLIKESIFLYIQPEGTIKSSIIIAANCSQDKIRKFSEWYGSFVFNKRTINIFFLPVNLTNIPEYTDLLLICGPISLDSYYQSIIDYLSKGKGVIEIADFTTIDQSTQKIFGINVGTAQQTNTDVYIKLPSSAKSDNYYPYKFFYNIPLVINASYVNQSSGKYYGNFTFRNYSVKYEIDPALRRVTFYTNPPISVIERQAFKLYGYNFMLSYIVSNSSISLSFKKLYNFTSFRRNNNIVLIDGNEERIFLYEGSSASKMPVAVLNTSKVAWIADFDRYNNATHDQKLALLSLILTVSEKVRSSLEPYTTYKIPYLGIEGYDMYEVYKVNLGIAYPSG